MRLYEITEDMRELQRMADDGELSADDISATMEGLELEFDDKARACLKVRQSMLGSANALNAEIERMEILEQSYLISAMNLQNYVKNGMLLTKRDKVDLGIFKLSIRKATKKLGELDEDKIPKSYFTEVPATTKLDKKQLLKDAKESAIEGVTLTETARSLTIK